MSDFPYVAPPVDGLRQAMLDARGRRFRTAGFTSASVATALVAVLAVLGGTGTQSLVQQPAPEQPAVTRLVPGPDEAQGGTDNAVGALSAGADVSAAGLRPAGAGGAAPETRAQQAPLGSSGAGSGDAPRTTTAMRRSQGSPYTIGDSCPVAKTTSGKLMLCPAASYSQTYDDNGNAITNVMDLIGSVCSYDTSSVLLHFDTDVEADVAVLDSKGHELWRWSREHVTTADPHTVSLGTGECWDWTTRWTGVDQRGRHLPAGTYTLRATSFARELGSQNTYETSVRVS
jgi:hypothetical protein